MTLTNNRVVSRSAESIGTLPPTFMKLAGDLGIDFNMAPDDATKAALRPQP